MRAFLKSHRGRTLVVQCWGYAVRGKLEKVRRDGIVMSTVQILDETDRTPQWTPVDGEFAITAGQIRYAQAA